MLRKAQVAERLLKKKGDVRLANLQQVVESRVRLRFIESKYKAPGKGMFGTQTEYFLYNLSDKEIRELRRLREVYGRTA